MRTYLLPRDGQFYKANMHSHSTNSDGAFTPEELKAMYKEKGYSVFAYTEHGHLDDMRYLDDDTFLTLPSYELDFSNRDVNGVIAPGGFKTTMSATEVIHMNLFATDPERARTVEKKDIMDLPWLERLNTAIHRAKEMGYFVSFNHPHWSLNPPETYLNLPEIDGLEIINGAAHRSSGLDFVPHVHRALADHGKRTVCIAGDDNHRKRHLFLAWTMIKAPALTHSDIMGAVQAGNCYATMGPEIKELYVEDGVVHVKTSEVQAIHLNCGTRRKAVVIAEEQGQESITEASFPLVSNDIYFHIMLKDLRGKSAISQIYYLADYDWNIQ